MAADHQQIILALVAVIAPLVGALVVLAKRTTIAAEQATMANRAVNNVGPGEHSLWDQVSFVREDVMELVEAQRDFAKRGWQTLPEDISTAARLTETIRDLQHSAATNQAEHDRIIAKIDTLADSLREHDRWERERYDGQP
jgi:Na+-translocating ferredoxin:NAD+ oxidoreductase RnfG subunit